jgi:hypothetical protein
MGKHWFSNMLRTPQIIACMLLGLDSSSCWAMNAMTNDEVRQEIMKGALKDYESGSCPAEYVMKPDSPVQISESSGQAAGTSVQNSSKSGTNSRESILGVNSWFNNGPAFSIGGAIGQTSEESNTSSRSRSGSKSESKSYTEYPGTCTCPCPYSRDLKGKECGDASVYFQYPDGDRNKIPCYASDIQDWQITEYRQHYGIASPDDLYKPSQSSPNK